MENSEGNMYFVYIMTNEKHSVLYVGSTGDLVKRVYLHRNRLLKGFTAKYNIIKLVYYEVFKTEQEALDRENKIKVMTRRRKEDLINKGNPFWSDLYFDIKGRF